MGKARAYELQQRPWYKPLRKYVVIEYVEEYKRWGLLAQRMIKDEGKKSKERESVPPFQITIFFGNSSHYNKLYVT